jgi:hypothetical protein
MDEIRTRAKDHFPSVLLTLLSIIQALSLEVIWSTATSNPHLFEGGLDAWISWLQLSATFLGIILVWLMYISIVMRIVWVPTFRDSVIPFVIGLGEFVLAWMVAPELRPIWFLVLAGVFVVCSLASYSIFSRAVDEEENAAFYSVTDTSGAEGSRSAAILVVSLIGLSALLAIVGPSGLAALVAVLIANGLILFQTQLIRTFWHRSIQ